MKLSFKFLFLLISLLFFGCGSKTEYVYKTRYVYIEPSYPVLQKYEVDNTLKLTAYNKGNFVCIKEWNNSCIPKYALINLISYISEYKTALKKCNKQIDIYNKFIRSNKGLE